MKIRGPSSFRETVSLPRPNLLLKAASERVDGQNMMASKQEQKRTVACPTVCHPTWPKHRQSFFAPGTHDVGPPATTLQLSSTCSPLLGSMTGTTAPRPPKPGFPLDPSPSFPPCPHRRPQLLSLPSKGLRVGLLPPDPAIWYTALAL